MAAHAGREVVELEQLVQGLRLGLPALHGVQQRELPVQQRLAAPGQVAEHLADAAPHAGLADGRLDGRALHRGERLGHPGRFPDPARHDRCVLGGYLDVFALAEPLDHVRQPFFRQHERGPLQPAQLTADPAAEPHHEEDGQDDREQSGAARQSDFKQQLVAHCRALGGQRIPVLGLGLQVVLEQRGRGGAELLRRDRYRLLAPDRADDRVLDRPGSSGTALTSGSPGSRTPSRGVQLAERVGHQHASCR